MNSPKGSMEGIANHNGTAKGKTLVTLPGDTGLERVVAL